MNGKTPELHATGLKAREYLTLGAVVVKYFNNKYLEFVFGTNFKGCSLRKSHRYSKMYPGKYLPSLEQVP